MRFFGRSLTGLFLAAVTIGLLGLAVQMVASVLRGQDEGRDMARPQEERVIAANVIKLSPEGISPVLTAFGQVESRRTLDLRSRQAGTVVWVSDTFRNGGKVAAGEPLFRIDPVPAEDALALATADAEEAKAREAEARAAVTLARDDLAAAEAQALLRRQALTRQQELVGRGVGSSQAVETAELAVSSADQAVLARRQALASAEATISQAVVAGTRAAIAVAEAERALAETEVHAEFAGLVDAVTPVVGAEVGANEAVGRLLDPAALDVAMRLSTSQFGLLINGVGELVNAEVGVTLDAGATEITATGRLDRVAASVGEGQTGRLVYVALDGGDGLRPGDFVTVEIKEAPLADATVIAATALGRNGTVLALGPEDRLEEVPVDVLRRQGDEVIIRVGSLAGREIVAERTVLLGDGIRIRPVRPSAAATSGSETEMVALSDARRAELVALVEASVAMPAEAKARMLQTLQASEVPAQVIERLEQRKGG